MTAEQTRDKMLELIRSWLQDERVKRSEIAVLVLNDLAGDIMVLDLEKK